MDNKKEYIKPSIEEEDIYLEDIIMISATEGEKNSAFKSDRGIWDIFRW